MGGAKRQLEEYYEWLVEQDRLEQASYDEARSRLRMSCTCKDMRRPLSYPLSNRIVEIAGFKDYSKHSDIPTIMVNWLN